MVDGTVPVDADRFRHRPLGHRQEKGTAVGTMGICATGIVYGRVEPRSDVYSLGATLFLLTGSDPQTIRF